MAKKAPTKKTATKKAVKKTVSKKVAKKVAKKKAVTKKKTTKPAVPPVEKKFSLEVLINSERYFAEGDTITECLNQISIPFYKTKATINISSGTLSTRRVLYPVQIKRLLFKQFDKEVFEARMLKLLK